MGFLLGVPRVYTLVPRGFTKTALHVLGNILFPGRQKRNAFLSESGGFLVLSQGGTIF